MPATISIPPFEATGVLPPVIGSPALPGAQAPYRVSLVDVVRRFSGSEERRAILRGFLALCGSILLYNDASEPWRETLAIALGTGEMLWLGWLLQRGAMRNYPALLLWLAFLLLTIASSASGRVAYAGIAQAKKGEQQADAHETEYDSH